MGHRLGDRESGHDRRGLVPFWRQGHHGAVRIRLPLRLGALCTGHNEQSAPQEGGARGGDNQDTAVHALDSNRLLWGLLLDCVGSSLLGCIQGGFFSVQLGLEGVQADDPVAIYAVQDVFLHGDTRADQAHV